MLSSMIKVRLELPYILLSVFISLSIWLSLEKKKTQQTKNYEMLMLQAENNRHINSLDFQIGVLRHMLELNLKSNQSILLETRKYFPNMGADKLVLYLKSGGCDTCNIGVVGRALRNLLTNEHFYVFSHPENLSFLQSLAPNEDFGNHARVIVSTTQLYPHPPRYPYDAELLFLDHNNKVTGIIPIEYLKEEGLFDWLVERFLAAEYVNAI